jgi:hypothetical protein
MNATVWSVVILVDRDVPRSADGIEENIHALESAIGGKLTKEVVARLEYLLTIQRELLERHRKRMRRNLT